MYNKFIHNISHDFIETLRLSVIDIFNFDTTRPVLVLDDCTMYRTATKGMLIKFGFKQTQIHLASNAKVALEKCQLHPYQLVICDYNLGNAKNGYQLIDELRYKNYLNEDCILLIVTGDSSKDVVQGFAEYEPDGYLIKPLNYTSFHKRLLKFSKRKGCLTSTLNLLKDDQQTSTFKNTNEHISADDDIIIKAQIISAKTLFNLGQFEKARKLLEQLHIENNSPQIAIELAKISIYQKNYTTVDLLLSPLLDDVLHGANANYLMAELHFNQGAFVKAFSAITKSVNYSPKNVERQYLKALFALINFQLEQALISIKDSQCYTRHSFRDRIEIYQTKAMIYLDTIDLDETKNTAIFQAQYLTICQAWRSRFPPYVYKPKELVSMARFYALQGKWAKSKQLLAEHQSWLTDNIDYEMNYIEHIELAKVSFLLKNHLEYNRLSENICINLKKSSLIQDKALLIYFNRWCKRLEIKQKN